MTSLHELVNHRDNNSALFIRKLSDCCDGFTRPFIEAVDKVNSQKKSSKSSLYLSLFECNLSHFREFRFVDLSIREVEDFFR